MPQNLQSTYLHLECVAAACSPEIHKKAMVILKGPAYLACASSRRGYLNWIVLSPSAVTSFERAGCLRSAVAQPNFIVMTGNHDARGVCVDFPLIQPCAEVMRIG